MPELANPTDVEVVAPAASAARRGSTRRALLTSLVVAVLSVVALGLVSPSYSLATSVLVYAIAVLGCNLLLGYTGLMSFGQGVFFGVAAYAAGLAYVHWHVDVVLGLVLGAVAGLICALVVGFLCIMQRGVNFVMLTFAFAGMFGYMVYFFSKITGGENGLRGFPVLKLLGMELRDALPVFGLSAVLFVLIYVVLTLVVRSRLGAVLMAIRENEGRAMALGYDSTVFKLIAFVISGTVTGLGGALYATWLSAVPNSVLQLDISTMILIMTILGGTGSLYGSFLGAWVYILLSDMLSTTWQRWQIILAVALVAIVLYLQGGIWGALVWIWGKVRGRLPRRKEATS